MARCCLLGPANQTAGLSFDECISQSTLALNGWTNSLRMALPSQVQPQANTSMRRSRRRVQRLGDQAVACVLRQHQQDAAPTPISTALQGSQGGTSYDLKASPKSAHVMDDTIATSRIEDVVAPADSGDGARHSGAPGVQTSQTPSRDTSAPSSSASGSQTHSILTEIFPSYGRDGPGGWALPLSAYEDAHLMPPSSVVTPTSSGAPLPTSDSTIQQQQQQKPLPQVEQQLDTLLRAQMALSNIGESGLQGSSSSSSPSTTTASDRLSSESEGDAAARQSSDSSGSSRAPGTRSAQRQSQEAGKSLQWQSQGSEGAQSWSQAPTDSMTTATRPLGVGGPSVQELEAEQEAAAQDGIASLISSIRSGPPPRTRTPSRTPMARFLSPRSSDTANSRASSSAFPPNSSSKNSMGDIHAAAGPPRVAAGQEQQQLQQQQNVASSSSDPQKPFEPFQARVVELVSLLLQGVGTPSAAPSASASAAPQRKADPDPQASQQQQQQQQQQQGHVSYAGDRAPAPVSPRSPRSASAHSSSHWSGSSSSSSSSSSSTRMPPRIRRLLSEARQSHQNRSSSFNSATGTASSLGSATGTGTASGNSSSSSSTSNLGTDVLTRLAWDGVEDDFDLGERKVKAMAVGQQAAPAPSGVQRAGRAVKNVCAGQPEVSTGWLWGRRAGKRGRKAATGSDLPTAPLQVLARARALAAEASTLIQPRYPRPQLVNPDTQASTAFAPTTGQAAHLPSSSSSSSSNMILTSPRSRNSTISTTTSSGIGVASRGSGSAAIEGDQVDATGQAGVGVQASSGPEGETSSAAGLLTQAIAMNVVAAAAEQQLQGNGRGPLTAIEEYQQQQQQQQQQQRRVEQQSVSRDYAPANTAQQQLDELLEAAMANAGLPSHCSWREVCGLIAEFGVCAGPNTLAAMFTAVVRTAPLQATSSPPPSYPQQQQQQQQLRVEQQQPMQQQPDSGWLRTALYQGGLGGRYASAATPLSLAYQSISSYDDEEGGALPPSDSSSSSSSSSSSGRNTGRSSARDGFEGPATASGPGRVSPTQGVNREGERCRSVLLKLLRHLLSQLPSASMWDVSLCLHAAAAMKQRHLVAAHRVWPRLVPPLVARMQALIPQASAPELAGGLRAVVRLGYGPMLLPRGFTKLVQARFLALLNGIPGQSPPDHTALGQVGWCLAHLGATPSNGWLKEYSKAATRAVPEMYPVELILLSRPLVAWRKGSASQTRPARSNEANNTATTHDNDGASNTHGSSRNISSGRTNNSKPSSNTTTTNSSVSITSRGVSSSTLAPAPSRPRPGISQHLSAQPRSSHPSSSPAAAAAEKATATAPGRSTETAECTGTAEPAAATAPAGPAWEWPPLDLMDQIAQTTLQLLPPPLLPADRITDPSLCLMSPPSGPFAAGGSVHEHHLNLMNYHLQQQHILQNLQQQQQHGSANSGHTPEQWLYQQYQQYQLQEWWGQYSRRLRQRWLFPKDVAAVCACLAQAGWRPLPGWVRQLEAAIAPHLQAYSPRDLSLVVGSMTALAAHPRSLPPQQQPNPPQKATRSSQFTNNSMPRQQPPQPQQPTPPQGVADSHTAGTSSGNQSHEQLQEWSQTAANRSEAPASSSAGPPPGNEAVPDQATAPPQTARLPSMDFLALASLNLVEQMVIKQKRQRQQKQQQQRQQLQGNGAMNQTAQEEGQEQQEQWHQAAANSGSAHPLGQPLAPTATSTHSAFVDPDFAQAVSRFVGGLAHLVHAHLKLLKAGRAQQAQDAMRANTGGGLGSPGVPQPQVRGRASPALHKQNSAANAGGRGAAAQIAQVRSAGAGSDAALSFEQRGAVDAGAGRVAAGVQEKPGAKNTNSARGVAENVNSAGGVAELREAVWMLTANCYQMPGLAASLPANKAAQLLSGLLELSSALNLPPPPRSTLNRLEQAVLTRGGLSIESWQRVQRAYESARVAPGQSLQVALLTYL